MEKLKQFLYQTLVSVRTFSFFPVFSEGFCYCGTKTSNVCPIELLAGHVRGSNNSRIWELDKDMVETDKLLTGSSEGAVITPDHAVGMTDGRLETSCWPD